MTNAEIIKRVEEIVYPYFRFNAQDFYGDRGGAMIEIEDMWMLFFKFDGINKKTRGTSRLKQQELLDRVKNNIENIESAELSTVSSFGRYIVIKPLKDLK
jgi:hypothetical protein